MRVFHCVPFVFPLSTLQWAHFLHCWYWLWSLLVIGHYWLACRHFQQQGHKFNRHPKFITLDKLVNSCSSKDILHEQLIKQTKNSANRKWRRSHCLFISIFTQVRKAKPFSNSHDVIIFQNILTSCNDLQIQNFNKFPWKRSQAKPLNYVQVVYNFNRGG